MMLLLPGDVSIDGTAPRFAHRERTITRLPGKAMMLRPFLVNPTRRIRFDYSHGIAHRDRLWQDDQQMRMIGRAVDNQRISIDSTHDSAKVGEQLWFSTNRQCPADGFSC